jgi:predicted nucleic acid-binding protein
MILYLDTSALVKLYVEEPLSQELTVAVADAEAVATSLVAYVESRAAFARARREARLSAQIYRRIEKTFATDWPRYISIEVTDLLVKDAGDLAVTRSLRGYDALHLASAVSLRQQVNTSVTFLAFDRALSLAAKREALTLHPLGGR